MRVASLPIRSYALFFHEISVCIFVRIKSIFKGFFICPRQQLSENFQILVCLYLWFLGYISSDDGYLVELTHLSWNISESPEQPSLSVTNDTLDSPSFILQFFDSKFVVGSTLIDNEPTVDDFLPDSVFEGHYSYVSKVGGIYEEDDGSGNESFFRKDIGIQPFLNGSYAYVILL